MASVWEAKAKEAGASLARELFALRGRKGRRHNVEVHLTEQEVAALVAAAFETGAKVAELTIRGAE